MQIEVKLNYEAQQKMEQVVKEKMDELVEQVLAENVDEIVLDVLKKQLKSVALMYIQGNEIRQKMLEKVTPKVNELIGE